MVASTKWSSMKLPFCETYLCVLSHVVKSLKWHAQLIAISARDEVGVSFYISQLSFLNRYCTSSQ